MEHFLNLLFENKEPDEGFILIWMLEGKRSTWVRTASEAVEFVSHNSEQDIYVGTGISPTDFGKVGFKKRCPADLIIGIPAFYADIDIANPVHKKERLPKTLSQAIGLVKGYGWDPSMIVNTGHGIQAWWVFNEIWDLSEDEEREKAARLSKRLSTTIKNRCQKKGWDLDSVFDLSRVLRIPGTLNCKSEPIRAELIDVNGTRYEPSDMAEYFDPDVSQREQGASKSVVIGEFTIDPQANPPLDKLDALREIDPKFDQSWKGTRSDLASPSEFDLSLASFAAQAKWSDQEIANLIIAWRRIRGHDLKKALRQDYLVKTIEKAKVSTAEQNAEQALTDNSGDSEDADREALRTALSSLFQKIEVRSIKKFMTDPPSYTIETDKGSIDLGGVNGLINQYRFVEHIAAATGKLLRGFPDGRTKNKPKGVPYWRDVAQGLLNLCEEVEVGPDGTDDGEVRSWLVAYLESNELEKTLEDAAISRNPVIHDGEVVIFLAQFITWLGQRFGIKFTSKIIATKLRKYGAKPKAPPVVVAGKKTTRSVWALPEPYARYVD
jgi:hypothetical protein